MFHWFLNNLVSHFLSLGFHRDLIKTDWGVSECDWQGRVRGGGNHKKKLKNFSKRNYYVNVFPPPGNKQTHNQYFQKQLKSFGFWCSSIKLKNSELGLKPNHQLPDQVIHWFGGFCYLFTMTTWRQSTSEMKFTVEHSVYHGFVACNLYNNCFCGKCHSCTPLNHWTFFPSFCLSFSFPSFLFFLYFFPPSFLLKILDGNPEKMYPEFITSIKINFCIKPK